MVSTAFYCVADSRYFLGAVGLINSLRLVGHDEPIYVLDCGLSAQQRALIEAEATIVEGPGDLAPQVLKTIAPLAHPAETMILIDTDMIVTRPLTGLIATAAAGRVVGGSAELDRFCPEWEQILGLGPVHRRPYISTGLVLCGGALGQELIRLVDERKHLVDFELTFWRQNAADYPLVHADQDLINGVLAARASEAEIVVFEPRLSASPPFEGLEIVDLETIRCSLCRRHRAVRRPSLADQTVAGADRGRRLLATAAPLAQRGRCCAQRPRRRDPEALSPRSAGPRRTYPDRCRGAHATPS